jgi:hypothetical protein
MGDIDIFPLCGRLLKGGNFTAEEVERLKLLVDTSDLARSAVVRNRAIVACPLGLLPKNIYCVSRVFAEHEFIIFPFAVVAGHAALHYNGRPIQYLKRDRYIETKGTPPVCAVCERAATPEWYIIHQDGNSTWDCVNYYTYTFFVSAAITATSASTTCVPPAPWSSVPRRTPPSCGRYLTRCPSHATDAELRISQRFANLLRCSYSLSFKHTTS